MSEHPPKNPKEKERADIIGTEEGFWTDKEGNIHRGVPGIETSPPPPVVTLSPERMQENEAYQAREWENLSEAIVKGKVPPKKEQSESLLTMRQQMLVMPEEAKAATADLAFTPSEFNTQWRQKLSGLVGEFKKIEPPLLAIEPKPEQTPKPKLRLVPKTEKAEAAKPELGEKAGVTAERQAMKKVEEVQFILKARARHEAEYHRRRKKETYPTDEMGMGPLTRDEYVEDKLAREQKKWEEEKASKKTEDEATKSKESEVKSEPTPKKEEKPKDLAERAGVVKEKQAMREAEDKYLAAYKAYYENNSWLMRRAKSLVDTQEGRTLFDLKANYDKTRIKYGNALEHSAYWRLSQRKPGMLERHNRISKRNSKKEWTDEKYEERFQERYNKIVRFNEVIKPTAEKQIQARTEALGSKDAVLFEKTAERLSKANQWLEQRYGKTTARAIRSALVATAFATGGAAVGGFGVSALIAAGGYGAFRFGRSFALASVSAPIGGAVGELYGSMLGKRGQRKAKEAAKTLGRSGDSFGAVRSDALPSPGVVSPGFSARELDKIDRQRGKKLVRASDENLAKRKNIVRALAAFGVSGAAAIELSELPVFKTLEDGVKSIVADIKSELTPAPQYTPPEIPHEHIPEPVQTFPDDSPSVAQAPSEAPVVASATPEAPASIQASVTPPAEVPPEPVAPNAEVAEGPTKGSLQGGGDLDDDELERLAAAKAAAQAPEAPLSNSLPSDTTGNLADDEAPAPVEAPAPAMSVESPEKTIIVSADLGSPAEVVSEVQPEASMQAAPPEVEPREVAAYPSPPFETLPVSSVLDTPSGGTYPSISPVERATFIDQIRAHGVGPKDTETIAEFNARVANAPYPDKIVNGYGSFKVHLGETHIYRNDDDKLVVFGGDEQAQNTILTEYLRTHPNEAVFKGALGSDSKLHPVLWIFQEGEAQPTVPATRTGFFTRIFGGGLVEGPKPTDLKSAVF